MSRKAENKVKQDAIGGAQDDARTAQRAPHASAHAPAPAEDAALKIRVDPRNYRLHPDRNKALIAKSLEECGAGRSIVVDNTGASIAGSGVLEQADKLGIRKRIVETDGEELVVVVRKDISPDDPRRKLLALADNATSDQSQWDMEMLREDWDEMQLQDWDIELPVVETALDAQAKEEAKTRLADRFLVPPFSVLDTRRGEWVDRKRAWTVLIGQSGTTGESREDTLGYGSIVRSDKYDGLGSLNTVSIFDPVLAEIILKWFLPRGKCAICDPFAGGVFGYVAGYLGHRFTGIEIRPEQAALNNEMVAGFDARYICDDGQNIASHLPPDSQDLVFSCPPYFDLEHYSELPNDASNQKDYAGFLRILENGLTGAVSCLKNDRFAVVVMSNVRGGKKGAYYDICSDITRIMQRNGLILYDEIILINAIGSAAVRAARMMQYRKVVRVHQEVLVYFKGDPKNIKAAFPEAEVAEIEVENET